MNGSGAAPNFWMPRPIVLLLLSSAYQRELFVGLT
jgi:hypothetical protein